MIKELCTSMGGGVALGDNGLLTKDLRWIFFRWSLRQFNVKVDSGTIMISIRQVYGFKPRAGFCAWVCILEIKILFKHYFFLSHFIFRFLTIAVNVQRVIHAV